ncbi:adhesion G-protein coupled receptor G4 [Scomber japonicus]|uniref:adhesion G-protein coupled receptor G4 n=1 Tax=Scomber japonicus TaxID=13676 RepID=UPI0023055A6D|nr:adhesion G-protein coupled receptor G4 [Scomber japonicus]
MWQLLPGAVVPALKELSVCVLLRRSHATRWTGFVYKAPRGRNIELGLGGASADLSVWLFGEVFPMKTELKLKEWHSVCLTWSGQAQRLRVYINGSIKLEAAVNPILPKQLAQNGTLTLGISHYVDGNGIVKRENGKDLLGDIGLFRMWSREWSTEELGRQSCADGDVLSWDLQQWKYDCPPKPDISFHCAWSLYKIKMLTSIVHSTKPGNCSMSLEKITRNWLESIFPRNISVRNIYVSSQSHTCYVVNNSAAQHVQQPQVKEKLEVNGTIVLNLIITENLGNKLDIETDTTSWADPDMSNCHPLDVTISDLGNITVTTGNAAEIVHMIDKLVDDQLVDTDKLSSSELDIVVEKLNQVVDISVIKPALGTNIVNIVADILLSKTDVNPVANIVLNLTDRMGNNMKFQGESASLTAPSLALSMINVDQSEFSGLTFGVSSISSNLIPKIFVNQSFISGPINETNATISLPSTLNEFFPEGNKTRVQFQFYGTDDLFQFYLFMAQLFTFQQDPLATNATHCSLTLISSIVSASINDSFVNNLKDPVVVTLRHRKLKQPDDKVQCMFWDFQTNGGQGGWNSRGCETLSISSCQTSCRCNHLTHFAVLLDVSRDPISEVDSQILTVISYLGCGISSIFLGITLLTYLAFEKLRQDYPSKILINLSFALLGMSMLFLLDSWLSSFSNYGLCIATAATLHYFLLASFTWMGLEAVHMYLALVKVFNIYIPSYILKFCAIGWGIPLVIVSLVLAIDKDAYGSIVPEEASVALKSTDAFCWLQNDIFFYVTVVAFVLLILLCNLSVFIVVLIQIRKMQANKPSVNSRSSLNDLRAVASLTVLLGLTWTLAFFSFGPARVVLMYLFSILNTLQGFFVFLFHCLMKETVRKQWRIHLCCGRSRLSDYSDWSHSGTGGGRCKKNNLVNSDSVASTIRKVSDSSTGSRPNHH